MKAAELRIGQEVHILSVDYTSVMHNVNPRRTFSRTYRADTGTVSKTGRKWVTVSGTRYRATVPESRYMIAESRTSAIFESEIDLVMAMDRWCRSSIPEVP